MHLLQRNRGFSLVELLVATFIGLFLIGAMIQMYLSGRQSFQLSQNVGRIQEDTRFAYNFLTRDLRETSNLGCLRNIRDMTPVSNNLNNLSIRVAGWDHENTSPDNSASPIDLSENYVLSTTRNDWAGLNTGASSQLPNWINSVANSDTLMVKRLSQLEDAIVTPQGVAPGTKTTVINITGTNIVANDSIIVGNCQRADQFQVASVTGGGISITPQNGLSTDFLEDWDASSRVFTANNIYYYIGLRNGGNVPSLYRLQTVPGNEANAVAEELIDGVESMQVLYGISTSDGINANRYVSARDVADWTQVVSVRLGLIFVRPNVQGFGGAPQGQTYTVADGIEYLSVDGDRSLRYTTTITVKARNLGLTGSYATSICRPPNAFCDSQGYIGPATTP